MSAQFMLICARILEFVLQQIQRYSMSPYSFTSHYRGTHANFGSKYSLKFSAQFVLIGTTIFYHLKKLWIRICSNNCMIYIKVVYQNK